MHANNARKAVANLYLPTRMLNMPAEQHELMARSRDELGQFITTAEAERAALREEIGQLRAEIAATNTPQIANPATP